MSVTRFLLRIGRERKFFGRALKPGGLCDGPAGAAAREIAPHPKALDKASRRASKEKEVMRFCQRFSLDFGLTLLRPSNA